MKRSRPIATLALAAALACAAPAGAAALDLTKLKLGDGKVTSSGPKRGYVYACSTNFMQAGGFQAGPWINGSRWNYLSKVTVDGSVRWSGSYSARVSGSSRRLVGNGLPSHRTGTYPISSTDDAFAFDRNPNRIQSQSVSVSVTAKPKKASKATCTSGGPIGYLDSGAAIFNALDAGGQDAAAHEIQDRCDGHPQQSGQYHYHSLPRCLSTGSAKAHSKRLGWALDGFPIYGPRGADGKYMRNSGLDACHGHEHAISVDGTRKRLYHYHATMEYPYTLGCFRGTPVSSGGAGRPGGGPPQGGPPPG